MSIEAPPMSCPVRKRTADGRGRAGVLLTILALTRVKDASHRAPRGARIFPDLLPKRCRRQSIGHSPSRQATRLQPSYAEPPAADGALAPAAVIPEPRLDSRNVA